MDEAVLITDSGCDLSIAELTDLGVEVIFFPYTIDGKEMLDDFGRTLSYDSFYDALRAGARATTAQARPLDCEVAFQRAHNRGKVAVFVTISSGLSGTYETALTARDRFLSQNPGAKVYVVDSLSVSAGQGLLVIEMARMLADGTSVEDVVAWAEHYRLRVNTLFTVDSFEHLVRGGRISPAVGAVGSVLNIKPVLHVDAAGRLAPLKRLRGRHNALEAMSGMVAERIENAERQTIVIDHAQCPEDATTFRDMLATRVAVHSVIADRVGLIIGTHTGPSAVVVSFWGKPRG